MLEARAHNLVRETGMDFSDAFAEAMAERGAESRQSKATIKLSGSEQLVNWRSQLTARVSSRARVKQDTPNQEDLRVRTKDKSSDSIALGQQRWRSRSARTANLVEKKRSYHESKKT
jgi:hypothetical protein